jgi:hypothetical protein
MAYARFVAPLARTSDAVLDALRVKYVEMLAMRVEDAAAQQETERVRPRMAELASRFPGALREIDELPMDEIRSRIAVLEQALAGARQVEPWMTAMARFHALTRGALCAKRWLAGRKQVDAQTEDAFERAADTLRFPVEARLWTHELAALANPPRGRVTDAVFERLAQELDTTAAALRRLVFGTPRRERR